MRALINLGKGWALARKSFPWLICLFLLNLAFSFSLAISMHRSLEKSLGYSTAGKRMAEGFDYLWWEEFRDSGDSFSRTFSPARMGKGAILSNLEFLIGRQELSLPGEIFSAGLFFLLARAFMMAGVLTIFHLGAPPHAGREFLRGAARFFPTFLGFLLLGTVAWSGIGGLRSLASGLVDQTARTAASEIPPFLLALGLSLLALLLILLVHLLLDYARILAVTGERFNPLRMTASAWRFLLRHPGPVLGILGMLLAAQLGVTVLYLLLDAWIPRSSWLGLGTGFVFQQGFIFCLVWLRAWQYAAQMELVRFSG